MKTAVIVTTYNRPDALQAVLEGFRAQDTGEFELLIADDGSTRTTRRLVEEYAAKAAFSLRHVWQQDRGFRAGAARNRALAQTSAEYIVFSDGDCIPPPFFVSTHRAFAERGYFLGGNRILLSKRFTAAVLQQEIPVHTWSALRWLAVWTRGYVNRALPLLRLPDGAWRKRHPQRWEGIKTCNFSAWRSDLARANGFDERYSGWGLEDSDLVIRLLHGGVAHKSLRFAAPVFHLWHRENDRTQLTANRLRLEEIKRSNRISALVGLNQYG